MNKHKCDAALAALAAAAPRAVSGCICFLTKVVNDPAFDPGVMNVALRGLRGAGLSVMPLLPHNRKRNRRRVNRSAYDRKSGPLQLTTA